MNTTNTTGAAILRRSPIPPALRTAINRLAHEQAIQWEMTQRQALMRQAQGLWGAGAGAEAIEARLRQADAVERLRTVAS